MGLPFISYATEDLKRWRDKLASELASTNDETTRGLIEWIDAELAARTQENPCRSK